MNLKEIKGWYIQSVGGWKGNKENYVFYFNLKNI